LKEVLAFASGDVEVSEKDNWYKLGVKGGE
jgi:hypothetical protein